ncbi:MAG: hypothetical protein H6741_22060 [Alphaproteobacteria bacterium]|nr:hypothetical protein [Alphaproteobacteria bacterium]MCB9795398.1 hypothetical protein [Alphaproteobacteria bacterium]
MTPDWKRLAPHRPLHVGADAYVEPPTGGGKQIADWILAGGSTILVGGPVGIGKSTELRAAAGLLQDLRVSVLVQLDRLHRNMRSVTPSEVLLSIVRVVADLALRVLNLDLSGPLRETLVDHGFVESRYLKTSEGGHIAVSPETLANILLKEVRRLSRQSAICLLIDGLEKTTEDNGPHIFDALGQLPEWVDLVAVVPWHAAFGPRSERTIRDGGRLVALRASDASRGESGEVGREFLSRMLMCRLELAPEVVLGPNPPTEAPHFPDTVREACELSGGVPRTFLQLMGDAATFARLRRAGSWPLPADLETARFEQVDFVRRLLLPGDRELIRAADGTTGVEIALGARIRLLAHGVLLERIEGGQKVLRPHPLVLTVLGEE